MPPQPPQPKINLGGLGVAQWGYMGSIAGSLPQVPRMHGGLPTEQTTEQQPAEQAATLPAGQPAAGQPAAGQKKRKAPTAKEPAQKANKKANASAGRASWEKRVKVSVACMYASLCSTHLCHDTRSQASSAVFQGEVPDGPLTSLAGDDSDVGRWVLMPLSCYPELEVKKKGKKHLGWAVVVTSFSNKSAQHPYVLTEHGQTGTLFTKTAVLDMKILSD